MPAEHETLKWGKLVENPPLKDVINAFIDDDLSEYEAGVFSRLPSIAPSIAILLRPALNEIIEIVR